MLADSFFYYLVLVGFAAGLMDAAVGGGGLLQIPGLFKPIAKRYTCGLGNGCQ